MSLHWQKKSTKDFDEIVVGCLIMAIEFSLEEHKNKKWNKESELFKCASIFPDVNVFVSECKKLIKATKSSKLFMPTKYHFYMMWNIMDIFSCVYTEKRKPWFEMQGEEAQNIIEEGYKNREGQSSIDYCESICENAISSFDYIEDIYFWDLDFLSELSFYNKKKFAAKQFNLIRKEIVTTKDLRLTVYKENFKNK